MAILLTINGSTGLTFDEGNLPSQSNAEAVASVTTDVVNTSTKYLHGYFEYTYGSGNSARLASQDGKPLFAQFIPGGSFPKATIDTWISNAEQPPVDIFYVCEVVDDNAIPLDVGSFSYYHPDASASHPFAVAMEWDGAKFIPAQEDFTQYSNYEIPPTLELVDRKANMPASGTLSFKVTQDPNQPGYDGITWYNEAVTDITAQMGVSTSLSYTTYKTYGPQNYLICSTYHQSSGGPSTYSDPNFIVVDISTDPLTPVVVGTVPSARANTWDKRTMLVEGNYAYSLQQGGGSDVLFEIIDFTIPTNPVIAGYVGLNVPSSGVIIGKQGATIFIGDTYGNLISVDVSDKANPVVYGNPIDLGNNLSHSDYHQGYLYTTYGTTIRAIDVSNPNSPVETYSEDLHATQGISALYTLSCNASFADGYWYLPRSNGNNSSHGEGGLLVFDITTPGTPQFLLEVAKDDYKPISYGGMYDSVSNLMYLGNTGSFYTFRLDGANTSYVQKVDTAIVPEGTTAKYQTTIVDGTYIVTPAKTSNGISLYTSRFIDLSIVDKPISVDLANDFTAFDQLNDVNWLDQWGSNGFVTVKDVIYTPTTRPTATLEVLGSQGFHFTYYTNSSFPVDTVILPRNSFSNLGIKNTGSVRVLGYLDLIIDDGAGNLSRSSATGNIFKVDLLPNAEYPGDGILWWMAHSSSSTSIIKGVTFVAEGYEAANPNPLATLEVDSSGIVGFKYDPTAVPQDSTALAPSQIVSNIFNNADVELTGYFDAYYFDGTVEKQASVEGSSLTVDFLARDSYPRSSFTSWLNTFPNVPHSVWYHVGTYQDVTPAIPPILLRTTLDNSTSMTFAINDVPTATNHLVPSDIDTDIQNMSTGYFSGYFDYIYDDNGTAKLASESGLELACTYTPSSIKSYTDITTWLNSAPSTPSEVFFYVNTFSATDPNPGGGLPVAPVFSITIPVVRHYTDGSTPNDIADSAHYGQNTYAASEYYPTGQTTTSRYHVTDAVTNDILIAGLDANTPYRLVLIGDNVESVNFTTDSNGEAVVRLANNVDIANGVLTTTIYDAANNPIDTCSSPQTWASSARVIFIRKDGWCFYGSINIASGEVTTNAILSPGIYEQIIIRSQTLGELIPAGTTFKMIKPGFSHADLNAFLFSDSTLNHVREITITLPEDTAMPQSTSQNWEVIITETDVAPCGDNLDDIGDTYLDVVLNAQADGSISHGIAGLVEVDPEVDTDADGISDIIEGAPTTDTDGDGIEDYRDFDSDNDGIPDFVEGADDDSDNDGIPAFQDTDEGVDHWFALHDMPSEMVVMENYTFTIEHYAHSRIVDKDLNVVITYPAPMNMAPATATIGAGEVKPFTMLLSAPNSAACISAYPENPLEVVVTYTYNDAAGDEVTESSTYTINRVDATAEYPYKGNIVKWEKLDNTVRYNIYRKNPGELSYTFLKTVLNNSASELPTQYTLDRAGQIRSYYQISAVFADGTESDVSNALRSASYSLDLCAIQGVIVAIDGRPIKDAAVATRVKTAPRVINSAGIYAYNQHTMTNEDGSFVINAPQGSTIVLTIDDIGLRETLLVPLAPAIDFQEILELNNSEVLLR